LGQKLVHATRKLRTDETTITTLRLTTATKYFWRKKSTADGDRTVSFPKDYQDLSNEAASKAQAKKTEAGRQAGRQPRAHQTLIPDPQKTLRSRIHHLWMKQWKGPE
jgi:hypothetical protein